jgi:hypothetical protein
MAATDKPKAKRRWVIEDDDDEDDKMEYRSTNEDKKEDIIIHCARCRQLRWQELEETRQTWGTVAPHFDKNRVMEYMDSHKKGQELWTCNMWREKGDKVDYCMFVLCDDPRHASFAESDKSLRWRYCGDGHPTRSNWYDLIIQTNNYKETDKDKLSKDYMNALEEIKGIPIKTTKITPEYRIEKNWSEQWQCNTEHSKSLCGFSNERNVKCTNQSCGRVRRFCTDKPDDNWAVISGITKTQYEYRSEPTLDAFYRVEGGPKIIQDETTFRSDSKWQCGTRVRTGYKDDWKHCKQVVNEYKRTSFYHDKLGNLQGDGTFSYCDVVQCSACSEWRIIDKNSWYYMIMKELAKQQKITPLDGENPNIHEAIVQKEKEKWKCPYGSCKLKNERTDAKRPANLDKPVIVPGAQIAHIEELEGLEHEKAYHMECTNTKCQMRRNVPLALKQYCTKNKVSFVCCFVYLPCEGNDVVLEKGFVKMKDEDLIVVEGEEYVEELDASDEALITFNTSNIIPIRKERTKKSVVNELFRYVRGWEKREVRNNAKKLVEAFVEKLEESEFKAFCFWHLIHTTTELWMLEAYYGSMRAIEKEEKGDKGKKEELQWMYIPPHFTFTQIEDVRNRNRKVGAALETESYVRLVMNLVLKPNAEKARLLIGALVALGVDYEDVIKRERKADPGASDVEIIGDEIRAIPKGRTYDGAVKQLKLDEELMKEVISEFELDTGSKTFILDLVRALIERDVMADDTGVEDEDEEEDRRMHNAKRKEKETIARHALRDATRALKEANRKYNVSSTAETLREVEAAEDALEFAQQKAKKADDRRKEAAIRRAEAEVKRAEERLRKAKNSKAKEQAKVDVDAAKKKLELEQLERAPGNYDSEEEEDEPVAYQLAVYALGRGIGHLVYSALYETVYDRGEFDSVVYAIDNYTEKEESKEESEEASEEEQAEESEEESSFGVNGSTQSEDEQPGDRMDEVMKLYANLVMLKIGMRKAHEHGQGEHKQKIKEVIKEKEKEIDTVLRKYGLKRTSAIENLETTEADEEADEETDDEDARESDAEKLKRVYEKLKSIHESKPRNKDAIDEDNEVGDPYGIPKKIKGEIKDEARRIVEGSRRVKEIKDKDAKVKREIADLKDENEKALAKIDDLFGRIDRVSADEQDKVRNEIDGLERKIKKNETNIERKKTEANRLEEAPKEEIKEGARVLYEGFLKLIQEKATNDTRYKWTEEVLAKVVNSLRKWSNEALTLEAGGFADKWLGLMLARDFIGTRLVSAFCAGVDTVVEPEEPDEADRREEDEADRREEDEAEPEQDGWWISSELMTLHPSQLVEGSFSKWKIGNGLGAIREEWRNLRNSSDSFAMLNLPIEYQVAYVSQYAGDEKPKAASQIAKVYKKFLDVTDDKRDEESLVGSVRSILTQHKIDVPKWFKAASKSLDLDSIKEVLKQRNKQRNNKEEWVINLINMIEEQKKGQRLLRAIASIYANSLEDPILSDDELLSTFKTAAPGFYTFACLIRLVLRAHVAPLPRLIDLERTMDAAKTAAIGYEQSKRRYARKYGFVDPRSIEWLVQRQTSSANSAVCLLNKSYIQECSIKLNEEALIMEEDCGKEKWVRLYRKDVSDRAEKVDQMLITADYFCDMMQICELVEKHTSDIDTINKKVKEAGANEPSKKRLRKLVNHKAPAILSKKDRANLDEAKSEILYIREILKKMSSDEEDDGRDKVDELIEKISEELESGGFDVGVAKFDDYKKKTADKSNALAEQAWSESGLPHHPPVGGVVYREGAATEFEPVLNAPGWLTSQSMKTVKAVYGIYKACTEALPLAQNTNKKHVPTIDDLLREYHMTKDVFYCRASSSSDIDALALVAFCGEHLTTKAECVKHGLSVLLRKAESGHIDIDSYATPESVESTEANRKKINEAIKEKLTEMAESVQSESPAREECTRNENTEKLVGIVEWLREKESQGLDDEAYAMGVYIANNDDEKDWTDEETTLLRKKHAEIRRGTLAQYTDGLSDFIRGARSSRLLINKLDAVYNGTSFGGAPKGGGRGRAQQGAGRGRAQQGGGRGGAPRPPTVQE